MSSEPALPDPGGPLDLDQLVELEEAAFDDPWPEAAVASELCAPESLVLVLRHNDCSVGWCCFHIGADQGELLRLAVHPLHRRQGHGRCLLKAGLAEAQSRGAKRVFLEVREDNYGALSLYYRFGFQPVGQRPAYYQDGTAAFILSVAL